MIRIQLQHQQQQQQQQFYTLAVRGSGGSTISDARGCLAVVQELAVRESTPWTVDNGHCNSNRICYGRVYCRL